MQNKKEIETLMAKIELANKLVETAKDYAELLKISPKLKCTFNTEVIDEQIKVNESELEKIVKEIK